MLQTGRTSGHARPSHGEGQQQSSWGSFSPISATSTTASTPALVSACLHLSRARKSVVDQPTVLVGPLVKVPNCRHAEVPQVVTKLLQVLLAQYFRSLAIRTAC